MDYCPVTPLLGSFCVMPEILSAYPLMERSDPVPIPGPTGGDRVRVVEPDNVDHPSSVKRHTTSPGSSAAEPVVDARTLAPGTRAPERLITKFDPKPV